MMIFLTALTIIVMLVLLVAAHELGHYLFARWFGMGVEEFAIGFGRPILKTWMRKRYRTSEGEEETEFNFRPVPLGGFVRIKGMEPQQDQSETEIVGGFYSKPPLQRFIVLLAGPVFSIVAGLVILIGYFMTIGSYQPDNKPVLAGIGIGGPADKAGLKAGDKVLSIDGAPVATFYDMTKVVSASPGKPLVFAYERNGQALSAIVIPELHKEATPRLGPDLLPQESVENQGKILVAYGRNLEKLGFGAATLQALEAPVLMVESLVRIATGKAQASNELGGPVKIADTVNEVLIEEPIAVINLAGMLSISLGIFNLLPIFPLDGGQMLVALVEMLRRGKRLSFKIQEGLSAAGFVLIIAMVISVTYFDFTRKPESSAKPVQTQKR